MVAAVASNALPALASRDASATLDFFRSYKMKITRILLLSVCTLAGATTAAFSFNDDTDHMRPQVQTVSTNAAQSNSVVDDVRAAVSSVPRDFPIQATQPDAMGYYNLVLKDLCKGPNTGGKLAAWVDEVRADGWLGGTTRTAALVAVVTATIIQDKKYVNVQAKVPVYAVSNSPGNPGVKTCSDQFIITDVQYGSNVRIHFEFATKEERRVNDALVASIVKVATAVSLLQGPTGIIGAGVVLSLAQANTAPVANLTSAINEMLNQMNRQGVVRPTSIIINRTASKLSYRNRTAEVLEVNKNWRPAKGEFEPAQGYRHGFTTMFNATYGANLNTSWNTVVAANTNWPANPGGFCDKLRYQMNHDTDNDTLAVAIAIAAHAYHYPSFYESFPEAFRKKNRACLNQRDVELLRKYGWGNPMGGSWDAPAPPPVATSSVPPAGEPTLLAAIGRLFGVRN
jgi:hypothetical protein